MALVYVIQGAPGTPIKVGFAIDVLGRMRTLQTGNPQVLRIIDVIPGGQATEAALHRYLAQDRIILEWFQGPKVNEFIPWFRRKSLRAVNGFDQQSLPRCQPEPTDTSGLWASALAA